MSENIAFIEHQSIATPHALLNALDAFVGRVMAVEAAPVLLAVAPGHVGVWTPAENPEHLKVVGEEIRRIGQALVEQADTAPTLGEPRA